MNAQPTVGLAHFMAQTDSVGTAILFLLLAMSVATWYLIATQALTAFLSRRRTERFLALFRQAPSLHAVAAQLDRQAADEPFSNLAHQAIRSTRHHQCHGANTLAESGSLGEFLTRSMRRVLDEETTRFESGLTVLASIGSTAPFLGLFGTVWGVYHALVSIGMSGQGTLDKVAGPVGEALIMTALGLAVAIPAVLAYNFAVRRNRLVLARLDSFAHDLYAFLTTGAHVFAAHAPVAATTSQPALGGAA